MADAGANRRGQLLGVAFLLIAVLAAVLLATGALSGDDPADDASVVDGVKGTEETTALLRGIPQDGLVLGKPDAPVTIVEFVDFKCPVCKSFVLKDGPDVVNALVRTGKAKVELRALANIGPDSSVARRAFHGLAAQGKAWAMAELLFYNQGPESDEWATPALLTKIGKVAPELRGAPIVTASNAETTRMGAEADALGKRLDVSGTPTIFVRPTDRTDDAAYRKVSLKGTGSKAGKVADAVADLGR